MNHSLFARQSKHARISARFGFDTSERILWSEYILKYTQHSQNFQNSILTAAYKLWDWAGKCGKTRQFSFSGIPNWTCIRKKYKPVSYLWRGPLHSLEAKSYKAPILLSVSKTTSKAKARWDANFLTIQWGQRIVLGKTKTLAIL